MKSNNTCSRIYWYGKKNIYLSLKSCISRELLSVTLCKYYKYAIVTNHCHVAQIMLLYFVLNGYKINELI